MRICLASLFGEGSYFSWLFDYEGQDSSITVKEPNYAEALAGLVKSVPDVDSPEDFDLVCFDTTGMGELADEVAEKVPTIGDSTLADKLEEDRIYGLDLMAKAGVKVSLWEAFDNPADGMRFIRKTGKRFVFKPVGDVDDKSTTYVSKSAEDMLRYFDVLFRSAKVKEYVLQEVVEGVEVSTQVYLNESGYYAQNHTLECKRLLNDELGPNTGCSGSLVWMAKRENALFEKGLKKLLRPLQEMGYVGPIDLNTIINAEGVWGLELCPRFGYDSDALLARLLPIKFSDFLAAVATGESMPDLTAKHPFCASVRLSIPPYPTEHLPDKFYKSSVPIVGLKEEDLKNWFIYDVRRRGESDDLETAGLCGWIGSPLCVGETIGEAFSKVYDELKRVRVPNGQYRTDVCDATSKRYWQLRENGFLK
jgi:phosphoribosylamine---glycine ligase